MNDPQQPVAIVTGASRGIGHRIAEHLQAKGFDVLSSSRQSLENRPDGWTHVAADLGTPEGLEQLLDHPLATRASVLVNNVGQIRAVGGLAAEVGTEVRATFDTNVFGPLECCRRIATLMAEADFGRGLSAIALAKGS